MTSCAKGRLCLRRRDLNGLLEQPLLKMVEEAVAMLIQSQPQQARSFRRPDGEARACITFAKTRVS